MIADLKQELIEKISATEDENLLMLLNDDYDEVGRINQRRCNRPFIKRRIARIERIA